MDDKIAILFTLDEINAVLTQLGKQPFNEVFQLISLIQMQGQDQANKILEKQKAEETKAAEEATPVEAE
jgi:hypothetical protein